jgi:hypothetical protein
MCAGHGDSTSGRVVSELVYGSCGCQSARGKGRVSAGCGGWVTKPSDVDVPGLEELGGEIRRLDYVSEVGFMTEQSALRVLFEGGKAEQEEIEEAVREAGYEIFKVSS